MALRNIHFCLCNQQGVIASHHELGHSHFCLQACGWRKNSFACYNKILWPWFTDFFCFSSTYRRYQFQFPREYFSSPGDCQIISYCSQEYLVQNYHRPLQIHFSFPRSTWPAYIPFWFRSVFAGEKFKTAYRKGRWEKKIYIYKRNTKERVRRKGWKLRRRV